MASWRRYRPFSETPFSWLCPRVDAGGADALVLQQGGVGVIKFSATAAAHRSTQKGQEGFPGSDLHGEASKHFQRWEK